MFDWQATSYPRNARCLTKQTAVVREDSTAPTRFYDIGFVEDHGGMDAYVRVLVDKRETFRVTGASVEIKFRAFQYLRELLLESNRRGSNVATRYAEEVTNRFTHAVKGNR